MCSSCICSVNKCAENIDDKTLVTSSWRLAIRRTKRRRYGVFYYCCLCKVDFRSTVRGQKKSSLPQQCWKDDLDTGRPKIHTDVQKCEPKKRHKPRRTNVHMLHAHTDTHKRKFATTQPVTIFIPKWKYMSAPGLWKMEENGWRHYSQMHFVPSVLRSNQRVPQERSLNPDSDIQTEDTDNYSHCQQKLIYSVINSEMSSFPLANIFWFLI